MKFTPIAVLVMSSLAAFAQSASAQAGAEGRMNFLRDARASTSGPQFEFSRLQYGPLPISGSRVASPAGPLQAAERGDAKAQNQLGEMYMHGQGVPQNAATAVQWFRKAAAQNHVGAQNSLGALYASGQGVPQNYREAAQWYARAAQQGNAVAQYNLSHLYQEGLGVPQSFGTAAQWLEPRRKAM